MGCTTSRDISSRDARNNKGSNAVQELPLVVANHDYLEKLLNPVNSSPKLAASREIAPIPTDITVDDIPFASKFHPGFIQRRSSAKDIDRKLASDKPKQLSSVAFSPITRETAIRSLLNIQMMAMSASEPPFDGLSPHVIDAAFDVFESLRSTNYQFYYEMAEMLNQTRILISNCAMIGVLSDKQHSEQNLEENEYDLPTLMTQQMPERWLPRAVILDSSDMSEWGTSADLGMTSQIVEKIGFSFECWFYIDESHSQPRRSLAQRLSSQKRKSATKNKETTNHINEKENQTDASSNVRANKTVISDTDEESDLSDDFLPFIQPTNSGQRTESSGATSDFNLLHMSNAEAHEKRLHRGKFAILSSDQIHENSSNSCMSRTIEPILCITDGKVCVRLNGVLCESLPSSLCVQNSSSSSSSQSHSSDSYDVVDYNYVTTGMWRHIAMSYSNKHVRVYLDAQLIIDSLADIGAILNPSFHNTAVDTSSGPSGSARPRGSIVGGFSGSTGNMMNWEWEDRTWYLGPIAHSPVHGTAHYTSSGSRAGKMHVSMRSATSPTSLAGSDVSEIFGPDTTETEHTVGMSSGLTLVPLGNTFKSSKNDDSAAVNGGTGVTGDEGEGEEYYDAVMTPTNVSRIAGGGDNNGDDVTERTRKGFGQRLGRICEARLWLQARSREEIKGTMNRSIPPSEAVLTSGLRLSWLPLSADLADGCLNMEESASSTNKGGAYKKSQFSGSMARGSLFYDVWARAPLLDRRGPKSELLTSMADSRWPCCLPPHMPPPPSSAPAAKKTAEGDQVKGDERDPTDDTSHRNAATSLIVPTFLCDREEVWERIQLQLARAQPPLVMLKHAPLTLHAMVLMKTLVNKSQISRNSTLRSTWIPRVVRLSPHQRVHVGSSDELGLCTDSGFTVECWIRFPSDLKHVHTENKPGLKLESNTYPNTVRSEREGTAMDAMQVRLLHPPDYLAVSPGKSLVLSVSPSQLYMSFDGDIVESEDLKTDCEDRSHDIENSTQEHFKSNEKRRFSDADKKKGQSILKHDCHLARNTWIHVAFCYRDGIKRILLDGRIVSETASDPLKGSCLLYQSVSSLHKSASFYDREIRLDGENDGVDICEFRLWSRCLSRSEIRMQRHWPISPLRLPSHKPGTLTKFYRFTKSKVPPGAGLRLSWFPLRRGGYESAEKWGHVQRTISVAIKKGNMSSFFVRASSEVTEDLKVDSLPYATLFWDREKQRDGGRVLLNSTGESSVLNTSRVHLSGVPSILHHVQSKTSESFRVVVAVLDDWSDAFDLEFIPFSTKFKSKQRESKDMAVNASDINVFMKSPKSSTSLVDTPTSGAFATRSLTLTIPSYLSSFSRCNPYFAKLKYLSPLPSPSSSLFAGKESAVWIPRIFTIQNHQHNYNKSKNKPSSQIIYNPADIVMDGNSQSQIDPEESRGDHEEAVNEEEDDRDYTISWDELGMKYSERNEFSFTIEFWIKLPPMRSLENLISESTDEYSIINGLNNVSLIFCHEEFLKPPATSSPISSPQKQVMGSVSQTEVAPRPAVESDDHPRAFDTEEFESNRVIKTYDDVTRDEGEQTADFEKESGVGASAPASASAREMVQTLEEIGGRDEEESNVDEDANISIETPPVKLVETPKYSRMSIGLTDRKPFITFSNIESVTDTGLEDIDVKVASTVCSPDRLDSCKWTHIAYALKSNGVLNIFINGMIAATGFLGNVKMHGSDRLVLFAGRHTQDLRNACFCEFRIWSHAKSADEILLNMTTSIPPQIARPSSSKSPTLKSPTLKVNLEKELSVSVIEESFIPVNGSKLGNMFVMPRLAWLPMISYKTLAWNTFMNRPCGRYPPYNPFLEPKGRSDDSPEFIVTRRPHLLPQNIIENIEIVPIQQYLDNVTDSFEASLVTCILEYESYFHPHILELTAAVGATKASVSSPTMTPRTPQDDVSDISTTLTSTPGAISPIIT